MTANDGGNILEIRALETYYGKIQALKGIDLDVARGEIATIIGANGAGKTTLMMTVCGNPRAAAGSIRFEGQELTGLATHQIMHLGLAQSPEGRRIFPRMTEQQMLAIARALMGRPRLLMLDEPSLGLAPLIVKQIFEVIQELNKTEGLTVFLVEQNAYHALRLAHRGYVMVNGEITMSGTGQELLHREEIRAAYLEGGAH